MTSDIDPPGSTPCFRGDSAVAMAALAAAVSNPMCARGGAKSQDELGIVLCEAENLKALGEFAKALCRGGVFQTASLIQVEE